MAMKLGKQHLRLMIVVVLASLAYNLFAFWRRSSPAAGAGEPPLLAAVQPVSRPDSASAAATTRPAIDPEKIPAPPAIDMETPPVWPRDPFLGAGESRDPIAQPVTATPDPVGPDPTITSILISSTRRVALVDHRVVRVGDALAGGVVADIEKDAVVIRMPSGQMRRVMMARGTAGTVAPSGAPGSK
jgi:hypothetical protein